MNEEQMKAFKELGVNYSEVIVRFMGKGDFYIRMVKKLPADKSFEQAREALEQGDYAAMFEATHTLKGLVGNFGFQKLIDDVYPLNEELRNKPYNKEYIKEAFARISINYQEAVRVIESLD